MFANKFNIDDVNEKKSKLKQVTETVITRIDGTRYTENNTNGSKSALISGTRDEDGQWAILDEASALGLSTEEEEKSPSSKSRNTLSADESILVELLKKHPELSQYLIFVKVGVPLETIKSKMISDCASFPEGVVELFLQSIGATGVSETCVDTAVGESKDVLFKQSSPVGKPLKGDHSELHGHLGDTSWDPPTLASYSDAPARAGYNTEKGHEYLDSPQVLKEKVKLLASMLTNAQKPVIYAGAGLSTASGIGDYATQTGQSGVLAQNGHRGANVSPFCVSPNYGHHCIAALSKRGLVYRFIQQNHDGLPQKAGMNQGLINEIHGGWFDPSNPVVAMSGSLRSDLFNDLLTMERETDLVIAVGSSLCGMNADRLVATSANNARRFREKKIAAKASSSRFPSFSKKATNYKKEPFGSVIISLQKTVHDHNSSLRIFALIDDVFKLLAEELKLDLSHLTPKKDQSQHQSPNKPVNTGEAAEEKIGGGEPQANPSLCVQGNVSSFNDDHHHVFNVPYDQEGLLIKEVHETKPALMKLNLNDGAELIIAHGPDKGAKAVVLGRNKDGHYRISVERTFKNGSQRKFSETRLLGSWWPKNAMDGDVSYIPVISQ